MLPPDVGRDALPITAAVERDAPAPLALPPLNPTEEVPRNA
jgi:hypothetical protein